MRAHPVPEVVLMYHSVCAEAPAPAFRPYVVHPRALADHLGLLAGTGWATTTMSATPPPGRPVVALTFDDAYVDFATVVLPLLERHDLVATLYVATAYVGGTARWLAPEGEGDRAVLDWGGLAEVVSSGRVEIGAHSHTHPEMDRLGPARLAVEAQVPKALLEDRLGVPVASFAYPFGYHDARARRAVGAAGYATACGVDHLPVAAARSSLAIPRLGVTATTTAEDLAGMLAARAAPARRARAALARGTWRAYRHSPLWRRPPCCP